MTGDSSNICFIVGPGRSGSTLLYKILSLHPSIGFISNYDVRYTDFSFIAGLVEITHSSTATKLQAWFDEGGGAYYLRRPLLKKLAPTPVEGESLFAACGLARGRLVGTPESVGACLTTRFTKLLACKKKANVLLIKRTALNQSIPLLHRIFPDAHFIFLVRDGRSVTASLLKVAWWPDSPLPWAQHRTPAELCAEGKDMTWIAARNWAAGVKYVQDGLSGVPETQISCIRYEDFLQEPQHTLAKLQQFLSVPYSREFAEAVDQLKLARRPSEAWHQQLTPSQQQTVNAIQADLLSQYGYL